MHILRYRLQHCKIFRRRHLTSIASAGKSLKTENACCVPSTGDRPLLVSTDHSLCVELCFVIPLVWFCSQLGCIVLLWESKTFRKWDLVKGSLEILCRGKRGPCSLLAFLVASWPLWDEQIFCSMHSHHCIPPCCRPGAVWPGDHRSEHPKLWAHGTVPLHWVFLSQNSKLDAAMFQWCGVRDWDRLCRQFFCSIFICWVT